MQRFWTKGERVRVTDDGILVETGPLTQARRYWRGSKLLFVFAYAVGPALIVLLGVGFLRRGEWTALLVGAGFAVAGYVVLRGYYRFYRGFSTDDRIALEAVARVVVDEEWGNPRLVVEYRTDDGRRRRRLLMASSRFADGVAELETAVAVLRSHGIPVERGN